MCCINMFSYANNMVYPVHISDQKFKCMDLLMITNENKSHYVYIKDFSRCMCNKTKNKNKKHLLANIVYNVLVGKKFGRT